MTDAPICGAGKGVIPSASNRRPPAWLMLLGAILVLALSIELIRQPVESIFGLSICLSIICLIYSVFRLAAIALPAPAPSPLETLNGSEFPTFTILLPVYKEAHMIRSLLRNVLKLDYPADALDIIFVCEPNDIETIRAALSMSPDNVHVFITDGQGPRTKPNALNAAMAAARGDIITVYDAEDRPHPQQLRAAAHALGTNPNLAVAQAPLTYYNASQNWLTRQFTLEYDALFQVWLPFLAKLGLPFPLGGTSNHIRRTALEQAGGWDAHNVTEDADLSFRFAAYGWDLGYITPPTNEEAVSTWPQWRNQRSRWMKGYMQTWLTHMKRPLMPGGRKGFKRQMTLQITLGAALVAGLCHVPAMILLGLVCLYGLTSGHTLTLPLPLFAALIFSYSAGITIGMVGAVRTQRKYLLISTLAMPLYWGLLMFPTAQALYELILRPFYWNKTDHGDMARAASKDTPNTQMDTHAA